MKKSFVRAFSFCLFVAAAAPALSAHAASDVGWATYNGTYTGTRFSPLSEITPTNVGKLKVKCELTLGEPGPFQNGPLVIGKVMYVTTPHSTVALSAEDCKPIWRQKFMAVGSEQYPVNRGLAYLDGRLFRGTPDGRIFALDAKTGKPLWQIQSTIPNSPEFLSAAPIAWNGLVFLGPAGSDSGIRGRMLAYDVKTGKEVWRFDTIPMGNEPGAETWKNTELAKIGGGGVWSSFSLDPKTGELFIPVSNPAPTYVPDRRPGDNLYTNSVLVLDAMTGKLKWYYQVTPHDGFDYDLGAAPILYTAKNGRESVAAASKDGHNYIIDSKTHKLIAKTPVTTILIAEKPTPTGVKACPGAFGGVEWNGPAYSPASGKIYIGSVDWCGIFKSADDDYIPGPTKGYLGGVSTPPAGATKTGWIVALNGDTGKLVWRYHAASPVIAGVTPTEGGVVFGGESEGNFVALDAETGELLLKHDMGGSLAGGIVSYSVDGKQYVAVSVGNISRLGFSARKAIPHIAILTLGVPADAKPVKLTAIPADEKEPVRTAQSVYKQFCSTCHGGDAKGGSEAPSLVGIGSRMAPEQIADFIKHPKAPMPTLYPIYLNDADMKMLADYLTSLK